MNKNNNIKPTGKTKLTKKTKLILCLFLVIGILLVVTKLLLLSINFMDKKIIIVPKPISKTSEKIVTIKKREPLMVISPYIPKALDQDYDELNSIEKKLCDKFGMYNCKTIVAIQHCENGKQNPEATNINTNNTIDVGIMQINSIHWNKDYCYGLHDLTEIDNNIQCAYNIWDRADGVVGDNKGNFNAWSTLGGNCFINNL